SFSTQSTTSTSASGTSKRLRTNSEKNTKNLAESIQNNIEVAAKENKYGVSVSLDGWKNVVKQNILGLGAKDISRDRENTNAAIKHISAFLNETQSKNIKINTVITDSASSYNAAR
ncbi:41607_t:CDS:2, partial [Gigaspora margarita]